MLIVLLVVGDYDAVQLSAVEAIASADGLATGLQWHVREKVSCVYFSYAGRLLF